MEERIFCNIENRPFDASEFENGPDNVTIHTTGEPHTLDGWPAEKVGGQWKIKEPSVPQLPVIIAE